VKPLNSKELFRELCSNPSEILFFLRAVKKKKNKRHCPHPLLQQRGLTGGDGKDKIASLLLKGCFPRGRGCDPLPREWGW